MGMTLPPPGVAAILLPLVLIAAVYDVRYRRIPNWLTVGGLLIGLLLNAFIGRNDVRPGWHALLFSLAGLGVAFGVYVALYAVHAMGAGDVKLMAAVGAVVGWQDWFGIFTLTALVGGIMALIVIVRRKRVIKTLWNVGFIMNQMKSGKAAYLAREELDVKSPKSVGLPHGAVIAVGTVFFLAVSAHFAG
jgi:prepilin peptidase CpaA